MERILRKYIVAKYDWSVDILGYSIDGAICSVRFSISGETQNLNINIWEMLAFLTTNP